MALSMGFFEPDNMKQLAQALEQLLSAPNLRRRLFTNTREVVIRGFDWDRIAEKTIKVCGKVLEGSRAKRR